jgi:hypothetical protein
VVIRDILDEEIPMEKRLKAHMNLGRKSKKQ